MANPDVPAGLAAVPAAVPEDPGSGGWNNWYWAAIIAAVAAAAAALNHWRNRRVLDRTRSALALHPSLDPAEGNCVATDGLALAGPAVSIRSRLEIGSSAWR